MTEILRELDATSLWFFANIVILLAAARKYGFRLKLEILGYTVFLLELNGVPLD